MECANHNWVRIKRNFFNAFLIKHSIAALYVVSTKSCE